MNIYVLNFLIICFITIVYFMTEKSSPIDCSFDLKNPSISACNNETNTSTITYKILNKESNEGKSCDIIASINFKDKQYILNNDSLVITESCDKCGQYVVDTSKAFLGFDILRSLKLAINLIQRSAIRFFPRNSVFLNNKDKIKRHF